jgi:hypothetical protein
VAADQFGGRANGQACIIFVKARYSSLVKRTLPLDVSSGALKPTETSFVSANDSVALKHTASSPAADLHDDSLGGRQPFSEPTPASQNDVLSLGLSLRRCVCDQS